MNKKHRSSLNQGSVFRNQQTIGHLLIYAHSFPSCTDTCLFKGSLRWASYKMCGPWSWQLSSEMKGARSPRKLERWVQWSEQGCSCHSDPPPPPSLTERCLPDRVIRYWWNDGGGEQEVTLVRQTHKQRPSKTAHRWQHVTRSWKTFAFYQAKGQQQTTVQCLRARLAKYSYCCVTALKINFFFFMIFIFSFLLSSIYLRSS